MIIIIIIPPAMEHDAATPNATADRAGSTKFTAI